MTTIFHMADQDTWDAAIKTGLYAGTENDQADGFIHFSTAETVVESAAKHRAGVKGLLLIAVDADALGTDLKWEEARGGVLFPHLYANLKTDLVSSVTALPLGSDGRHQFPDLEGL